MSQPIYECLHGRNGNYLMPFLWIHGEDEATLREYMAAIDSAGIKAVCLESRPHPDFLGDGWWRDLDILLSEAKARNMKLWILDDKHFPTGQAAGAMETAPIQVQKQFLACTMTDLCGPQKRVRMPIGALARTPAFPPTKIEYGDDRLYAVVACRLDGNMEHRADHVDGKALDLTSVVQNGNLYWDVPAGLWRIFVFYLTHNGGTSNTIHLIDSASCKVLLDTVYEPHYARYAQEFGKTIAGFFSDEPGLGNVPGNGTDNLIGHKRMPLPWSKQLEEKLSARWGRELPRNLPALWCDYGSADDTARIRVDYMDTVTGLVQTCFSQQIGDWCRAHGVEYIGHIIEDNNACEGLGCSTGHYFRSLWGQDMAGIDDIGAQITMGGANVEHLSIAGSGDGEFYHHALGKLGSSLAHIDPKKHDRCVCECFGAYGWSEGTQLMKYIADHLMADGVNHFVPHAFSGKPFPDPDCPPHFYSGGEDILFPAFTKLAGYMNRLCHMLNAYRHTAPVALLYHAEAAWSGGAYQKLQRAARILREHQIDFDILPSELLSNQVDSLTVNGRTYEALVVPGCERMNSRLQAFCRQSPVPVYFLEFAPKGMQAWAPEELLRILQEKATVRLSTPHKDLRVYHGISGTEEIYFLFNSSPWEPFSGEIGQERGYRYDAMENRLYHFGGKLHLGPCESTLLLITERSLPALPEPVETDREQTIHETWTISYLKDGAFVPFAEAAIPEEFDLPGYSGTIRYEATVSSAISSKRIVLELPQIRETAKVWCNGILVGEAIAAPFVFDLSGTWRTGTNRLQIDVTTTMEQKVLQASGGRDLFTMMQKAFPTYGMVGQPILRYQ